MSEISRKNAILVLQMIEAHGSLPIHAKEKAISDMQKLEKIEKVIDTTLIANEPYKVKIETIEQILRGGENERNTD